MIARRRTAPRKSKAPFVEVVFLVQDGQERPITGLQVQMRAVGKSPAWKWQAVEDTGGKEMPPDSTVKPSAVKPAQGAAPASGAASASAAQKPAPAPAPAEPLVSNVLTKTTDGKGCAGTILNAANGQQIDVWVWSEGRKEWVWKTPVIPEYDINVVTIMSPEFHLPAAKTVKKGDTKLLQDLNVPKVNPGEVMTVDRLVKVFGPFIGYSRVVTETGEVKRHHVDRVPDGTEDVKDKHGNPVMDRYTHKPKQKQKFKNDYYYTVEKTGGPGVIVLNVLGSTLNYPKTLEISDAKYKEVAAALGCEEAAVRAVAMTETANGAFLPNGLPKILYERRVFYNSIPKERRDNLFRLFPNLCSPHGGRYNDKAGYSGYGNDAAGWPGDPQHVMHQYERFIRAYHNLNQPEAVIMACSWGAFQVLGKYWEECGYNTAADLANATMRDVDGQIDLFMRYLNRVNTAAKGYLKGKEWPKFAISYNGQDNYINYASRVKENYDKAKQAGY